MEGFKREVLWSDPYYQNITQAASMASSSKGTRLEVERQAQCSKLLLCQLHDLTVPPFSSQHRPYTEGLLLPLCR